MSESNHDKMIKSVKIDSKDGKLFDATISYEGGKNESRSGSFLEVTQWAQDIEAKLTDAIPEPPASETTPEQAQEINSNVRPAPKPVGAENITSGQEAQADSNAS